MTPTPASAWTGGDRDALAQFLAATPDAVVEYGPDLRYRWVNATAAQLLGRSAESVAGRANADFFDAAAAAELDGWVRQAMERRTSVAARHGLPLPEGERHFDSRFVPLLDDEGRCERVIGVCRDVTESVAEAARRSEALQRSEARFRAVFDCSVLGIAVVGGDGRPVAVNPALESILGRSAESLKGMRFAEFTHPDEVASDERLFRELVNGERRSYQLEKRYLRGDGEVVHARLSVSLMPDAAEGGGPLFLAFVEDVGERRRLENELRYYATHDPMTGLNNRLQGERVIEREAHQASRYGRRFALAMLDVDRFKAVNDSYGHEAGDRVLVEIAQALKRRLRTADALFRWGGEEFLVLISGADARTAGHVAESLRETVGAVARPDGRPITISVGLTAYRPGETPKSCIKRADSALYQAKQSGRDRVVVDWDD